MMHILEIIPTRSFNLLYIILDSLFIIFFLGLLIYKKKYLTLIWSIFGGILYFLVDFGYFYLISSSREIYINDVMQSMGNVSLILLWMSLSYGITNFAFIWLCLSKDEDLKMWLFLIIAWWLIVPSIASLGGASNIKTLRTTNQYHGIMAIILILGYFALIIYHFTNKKRHKIPILWLNLIGISVQFSWEFALLINGIRPMNQDSISTILINSLIETNLGMPYIYLIHHFVTKKYQEDLKKVNKEEICK